MKTTADLELAAMTKRDFPIFDAHPGLVYLDSAATTQRPRQVIEAAERFYREFNANPHRGAYTLSEKATDLYEKARASVAQFVGAASADNVVFLRSATEAINLVALGWGERHIAPGDEILVSELEHHSNLIPWQQLALRKGAKLLFLPMTENGELGIEALHTRLSKRTRLVALAHISNVMGTMTPLNEMIQAAHAAGAAVMIDGSQSVPHIPVDLSGMDADFFAFSGHKMMALMGIGVLAAKAERLEEMEPIFFGGEMISDVDYFQSTWNDSPWKFEAGTQNIGGALSLAAAISYIEEIGIETISEHDRELTRYALDGLSGIKGVRIHGPAENRAPVISFQLGALHAHDLATYLDSKEIAIRSGHHCAKLVMKRLNVPATARVSFYLYNSRAEIERLITALESARNYFGQWL